MVVFELREPIRDESGRIAGAQTLARLTVDGQEVRVEGDEALVDFDQRVLNLRTGEPISFSDGGEEWARGLAAALRTPYLWAEITDDTDPLPDIEIEHVEIEAPATDAAPAIG